MYAGHIAAALALKARTPRAPTWALFLAVGWLDVVHGALVIAGIERVHPDLTAYLGYRLDVVEWSHSLVAAVVWSLGAAAAFSRAGRDVAIAVGIGVFSHFALDALVHEHDLPLAPGIPFAVGLNLWGLWPIGAWGFEGALVAAAAAIYVRAARFDRTFGGHPARLCLVLAVIHISFLPALSPLRMAARFLTPGP